MIMCSVQVVVIVKAKTHFTVLHCPCMPWFRTRLSLLKATLHEQSRSCEAMATRSEVKCEKIYCQPSISAQTLSPSEPRQDFLVMAGRCYSTYLYLSRLLKPRWWISCYICRTTWQIVKNYSTHKKHTTNCRWIQKHNLSSKNDFLPK